MSAAYQMPPESGWVALLEARMKNLYPQYTVVNSSIAGDTTKNGLERLPGLLHQYHPYIVIIELGGNDALRGLPIPSIQSNLDAMIKLSLKANAKVLLVATPIPPNYGRTYTQQFDQIYVSLRDRYHIPLVPFLLEGVALNPKLMMPDGIHPTAEAQPILLENIWKDLKVILKEQDNRTI